MSVLADSTVIDEEDKLGISKKSKGMIESREHILNSPTNRGVRHPLTRSLNWGSDNMGAHLLHARWAKKQHEQGNVIVVPEIADYEVRR